MNAPRCSQTACRTVTTSATAAMWLNGIAGGLVLGLPATLALGQRRTGFHDQAASAQRKINAWQAPPRSLAHVLLAGRLEPAMCRTAAKSGTASTGQNQAQPEQNRFPDGPCVTPLTQGGSVPVSQGCKHRRPSDPPGRHDPRRRGTMVLFLMLLASAISLIVIGAVMEGMLHLLSIGVLLLIAAVLYLFVRSVSRSRPRPAR